MNEYDIGDVVRLTIQLRVNGTLTDPTTLVLSVRSPSGAVTTYAWNTAPEVIRNSVGDFEARIPAVASGTWRYFWTSTGTAPMAEPGADFYVRPQPF